MLAFAILAISCQHQTPGAKNAEQFAASHIDADLIESIETEPTDSLMSDAALGTACNAAMKAKAEYLQGTITREQYDAAQAEYSKLIDTFTLCWATHQSPKLPTAKRKTYKVTIKTKTHSFQTVYVLMDKDGTTPAMSDFEVQEITDQHNTNSLNCLVD